MYIMLPLLLLAHGMIWVNFGYSSAVIVYSMKLSYLIVLLGMCLFCNFKLKFNLSWIDKYILSGFVIVSFTSLLAPLLSEVGSLKYIVSDFVGFLLIPIYYLLAINFIQQTDMSIDKFLIIIFNSTFFISIVVVFCFFYSGGWKVSIPPEIHFGAALAVGFVIFRTKSLSFSLMVKIAIIVLACILSQQRINLMVLMVPVVLFFIRNAFNIKKIFVFSIMLASFCAVIFFSYTDLIEKLIASFAFTWSPSSFSFDNQSANQRLVEISLILRDLSFHEWYTYLFGKGFGALYYNYMDTIAHYNDYVHHAHSSPFIIVLRNGILGCLFIFTIPLLYLSLIFKKGIHLVVLSGLLSTYLALLVDLYIYWGALFAFSLALCSSVIKNNRVNRNFA